MRRDRARRIDRASLVKMPQEAPVDVAPAKKVSGPAEAAFALP
jgi:hypothetical protein